MKTENSWERVWTQPNKFQYNGGSELNEETANYETFYRPYDPAIGRFTGIDPLASSFTSWNPYQYAFNDPVFYNDPNGDCSVCDQHTLFEDNNIGVGLRGRGNFESGYGNSSLDFGGGGLQTTYIDRNGIVLLNVNDGGVNIYRVDDVDE